MDQKWKIIELEKATDYWSKLKVHQVSLSLKNAQMNIKQKKPSPPYAHLPNIVLFKVMLLNPKDLLQDLLQLKSEIKLQLILAEARR